MAAYALALNVPARGHATSVGEERWARGDIQPARNGTIAYTGMRKRAYLPTGLGLSRKATFC